MAQKEQQIEPTPTKQAKSERAEPYYTFFLAQYLSPLGLCATALLDCDFIEEVTNIVIQKFGISVSSSYRNPSFTSSVSSRSNSVSSRNTSNGSFSSSVGPGARAGYGRPQTAMGTSRPFGQAKSRPATSMGMHAEEDNLEAHGGMQLLPAFSSSIQSGFGSSRIQYAKPRVAPSCRPPMLRDVSLSTGLSKLRIDDTEPPTQVRNHQVISGAAGPFSTPIGAHKSSISAAMRVENTLVLYKGAGESEYPPQTPSQIPVLRKQEAVTLTPIPSPCKTPKTSPQKTQFLTKNSNIHALDWDLDGRVNKVEEMYQTLKDKLEGANDDRDGLQEAVGLYKGKGKVYLFPSGSTNLSTL